MVIAKTDQSKIALLIDLRNSRFFKFVDQTTVATTVHLPTIDLLTSGIGIAKALRNC